MLPEPPGHVEMLNLLCRSAGFRNYQHCKGVMEAQQRLQVPAPIVAPVDFALVERAERCSMSKVVCCVGRRRPRSRIFGVGAREQAGPEGLMIPNNFLL